MKIAKQEIEALERIAWFAERSERRKEFAARWKWDMATVRALIERAKRGQESEAGDE